MSRIGKQPIEIPSGVEVTLKDQHVEVKGPRGVLSTLLHPSVVARLDNVEGKALLLVEIKDETHAGSRAQWGTARAVLANLVTGVTDGYSKILEVNGVGYKVQLQGQTVILNAGFSHEVRYQLPEGVTASVEGNRITVSGSNKELVGQVAAEIRKVRKPEPYKGKGIKYSDEVIRRKAGKAAKSGE